LSRGSYKNPHAVSILNNPELMKTVRRKKQIEPAADTLVAQIDKLREIFRILRDQPYIKEKSPPNLLARDDLISTFPTMDRTAIDFAVHIEEKTSLLPMELFQLWVQVPERSLRNLVANCLLDDVNIFRVYVLVGLFLWASIQGYKPSSSKDFRFNQSQTEFMFKSMGLSESVARRILRETGLFPSHTIKSVQEAIQIEAHFTIPKDSILSQFCRKDIEINSVKYNRGNNPQLTIPEYDDLLARFQGYVLLYPADHYGTVHPIIPFVYYDGNKLRIPLSQGIVPALIGALFTAEEIGWLFNSKHPRQRNQKVQTVLGKASKSIRATDDWLKRFNNIAMHLPARHEDKRHDVLRVFNTMTHNGVQIDENALDKIDLDALDPKKHRIKDLKEEQKAIKEFIATTPGSRLYGKYRFHVYSERVYTRHYNIQALPNVFKSAVFSDPDRYFLYFDVRANDLSMLFHLSADEEGLDIVRDGKDPYRVIVENSLPTDPLREKAKSFVNPWIYGAGLERIVKNSQGNDGVLTLEEANLIKTYMSNQFCEATTWLKDVRWEVAKHSRIPAELNIIDGIEVPMPASLAPTRSAVFLVQRFGASLFRNILHLLAEAGYEPAVFVHDSVLIHIPSSKPSSDAIKDIEFIISQAISRKGIEAINVKVGKGHTWGEAEKHATPSTIFGVKHR
jgi:hypothetical protein